MKKYFLRYLVACTALFGFLSASAQNEKIAYIATDEVPYFYWQGDTTYTFHVDGYSKKLAKVATKGLHVDVDAAFSPFGGGWGVENTLTDTETSLKTEASLRVNYTAGVNVALVYQSNDTWHVGVGTGIRMQQLEFVENGAMQLPKSYAVPLYGRFGFCGAFTKDLAGYVDVNVGILFGTNNLKTTPMGEIQFGINYNSAKIGLGFMSTRPKTEPFIPEMKDNNFALSPALFLGFTL